MKKTYRTYIEMCRNEGFDVVAIDTSRKHCRLIFEAGFVTAAGTVSDCRNMMNVRSAVRRLHR